MRGEREREKEGAVRRSNENLLPSLGEERRESWEEKVKEEKQGCRERVQKHIQKQRGRKERRIWKCAEKREKIDVAG